MPPHDACSAKGYEGQHRKEHKPASGIYDGKPIVSCAWCGKTLKVFTQETQMTEQSELNAEKLPRCENLDGSTLKIVPAYTEAGYFTEAHVVTLQDAEGRKALYAPFKVL